MKNKWTVFLILLLGLNFSLLAEEPDSDSRSRHHYVNFSLFYPVSINQSKSDSVNFNLSLLYGHVGYVRGLDLAGLASAVEEELKGVQIAGLIGVSGEDVIGAQIAGVFSVAGERLSGFQISGGISVCGEILHGFQASGLISVTGNEFRGIQTTGGINVTGEYFQGLQTSGLINVTGSQFYGIQATGGINVVGETFRGLQVSGLINVAGESFKGIQATGAFNITGGTFKGLQVAGGFNIVGDQLSGLQVGTFNVTSYSTGAQIGIFNAAGEMNGFQLGLVNHSQETPGVPVGLVNISKFDGRIKWISWANNISGINSGVKFTVRNLYSIVALGGINIYKDITQSLTYAGFYGISVPLGRFYLNTDIGYMYMDNKNIFRSRSGEIDQQVIMVRGFLNWELSNKLSLFAGSGLSYISDSRFLARSGEYRPLFFAGLEVF
ncbi:MAG: hypothetical protein HQ555_01815 [Candidatus Aminicenantes bacterium]|nr:hypothetical protein [Candidatus Aminicenantes bacterium]